MDDSDPDLESEKEDEAVGGGGSVLRRDLKGWSHCRRGKRVIIKADIGAVRNLFEVSVVRAPGEGLGGIGTGGPVPAPDVGGAVQVGPALPLTPRRASPCSGEGRSAGVAMEDVDMGGTGMRGVAPAPVGVDDGGGCDCGVALAGVRREMVREIRKVREEMMGALALLLTERGLGTWEEGRKLERTRAKLVREREDAEKVHVVLQVAGHVTAEEERKMARAREAELKVTEAALRQEADRVTKVVQGQEANRNLEVAVLTLKGAVSDEERKAGCEVVAKTHEEMKRLESEVPTSPQVVVVVAWPAAGGWSRERWRL